MVFSWARYALNLLWAQLSRNGQPGASLLACYTPIYTHKWAHVVVCRAAAREFVRASPRVPNFLVPIYLYWDLAEKNLDMENTHLSNSALKFAKPAKNSNLPTVLFLAEKKAGHLLAPPSSIHVALLFLTEGLGVQRGEQIWLRIALLLGTRKKLGTDIGHCWTFVFRFFLPKTDYWRDLLGTLGDALN